jgi:hypothetical protein
MKLRSYAVLGFAAFVAACSGADGAQGAAGANGADGKPGDPAKGADPSASLVSPAQGILDRELDVEIGGSATKFADGAKPDFGAGITVVESTVSSPTLVIAKIKIAKDAKVGKRDVKIGDVTATGAFTVMPAIAVDATKVEQGGVVQFAIDNNDAKAFDTQAFSLTAPGVMDLGSQATSGQAAVGFVMAPPLAPIATGQITASNMGSDGKSKLDFLSDPTAFQVTARAPVDLVPGAGDQTFSAALQTKLFKLSTAANANAIVDLRMEVDASASTVPYAFVFGTGGQAADQLAIVGPPQSLFGTEPPPYDLHAVVPVLGGATAQDLYAVLLDLSGTAGNKLKLTTTKVNATKIDESTTAHAAAAPQALGALPAADGQIVDASLAAADEIDAYKVSGTTGDKIQIAFSSAADLEVIVTKDPKVLLDPDGTPAASQKVLADFYPGVKAAGNATVTLSGQADAYVVVKSDSQGKVASGKYTFSARKVP